MCIRDSIGIAAEDSHGDVVVGVDEARKGQHLLAVNDFIVIGKDGIFGKARDFRAVDGNILIFCYLCLLYKSRCV